MPKQLTPEQLAVVTLLDALTDFERTEVFLEYCVQCGVKDPHCVCQCMNHE